MSRNLLHKSKLDDFKAWLDREGIAHRPGRGAYQVLQVALPRNQWGVVFDRDTAPEHYTVTHPLEGTVRHYIRTRPDGVPEWRSKTLSTADTHESASRGNDEPS